jgi:hypothetical protein
MAGKGTQIMRQQNYGIKAMGIVDKVIELVSTVARDTAEDLVDEHIRKIRPASDSLPTDQKKEIEHGGK